MAEEPVPVVALAGEPPQLLMKPMRIGMHIGNGLPDRHRTHLHERRPPRALLLEPFLRRLHPVVDGHGRHRVGEALAVGRRMRPDAFLAEHHEPFPLRHVGAEGLAGERDGFIEAVPPCGRNVDADPVPLLVLLGVATAGILHRSLERADRLLPCPRHPIRFGLAPGDRQHRLRLPHADLPAPDGLGQQRAVPEPARESGHLLGGAGGDSQHLAGVVADADVAKPEDAVAGPEDVEVFADGDIEGATAAGDAGQDGVDGFRKEDADGLIPDAGDGPLEHRRGFGQRRQGVGWIDRRFAHSFWIAGPSDIQVHGPDAFSA